MNFLIANQVTFVLLLQAKMKNLQRGSLIFSIIYILFYAGAAISQTLAYQFSNIDFFSETSEFASENVQTLTFSKAANHHSSHSDEYFTFEEKEEKEEKCDGQCTLSQSAEFTCYALFGRNDSPGLFSINSSSKVPFYILFHSWKSFLI